MMMTVMMIETMVNAAPDLCVIVYLHGSVEFRRVALYPSSTALEYLKKVMCDFDGTDVDLRKSFTFPSRLTPCSYNI